MEEFLQRRRSLRGEAVLDRRPTGWRARVERRYKVEGRKGDRHRAHGVFYSDDGSAGPWICGWFVNNMLILADISDINANFISNYAYLHPSIIMASPFESPLEPSGHLRLTSDETHSRQGTGNSGSSDEINIIPGGAFEGVNSTDQDESRPIAHHTNDSRMDFPQTPYYATGFSCLNQRPPVNCISSQHNTNSPMQNIDERTRRMTMSTPLLSNPSKSSPLALNSMQPSAFHMMGIPMTPSTVQTSFPANSISEARPVLFSQPAVNFSPGPPLQLSSSLDGRRIIMTSPREIHFPSPTAFASSASTDGSVFSSSSTVGFPATPGMRFNTCANTGEETGKDVADGHQYPATPQSNVQFHAPSSVGSSYLARQYHPYRTPHSEPMNRFAPPDIGQSSVFAFHAPRHDADVRQDVFHSNGSTRHQHTGSLQFAIPCTPMAPSSQPLPIHSASLPSRSVLESPISPEARSFQSESEDPDDGFGMSRRPSALPLSGGEYNQSQSPKSPKKHIWCVTRAGFERF